MTKYGIDGVPPSLVTLGPLRPSVGNSRGSRGHGFGISWQGETNNAGQEGVRRVTVRWSRTNKNSNAPMKIFVHQELNVPWNVIIVWIKPSTMMPSTVPTT